MVAAARDRPWVAAVVLLFLAPVLGEVLSTATPPLDLLLPWNLALMVAMYGCGALLCREVAHRFGLGWSGLLLLAAAYGVYEEGLVDRFWYDPAYWSDVGVGDYSVVWHVNVLLATHLTSFHMAVSIVGSIVLVERMFPATRDRSWTSPAGMGLCATAMAAVVFVYWEEFYVPPVPVLLAAAGLGVVLVVAAFRFRVISGPPAEEPARWLGVTAFLCTGTHFVLVYAVPSTGLPWPIGLVLSLAPVVLGVVVVRRRATGGLAGPDALRVVTGILSFFLLLDVAVGLGGRFDLSVAGLCLAVLLWRLGRRPVPVSA